MLNPKRPHFLRCFNPSSTSERLKVPTRFIKLIEEQTSGIVTLVGPSGNTWLADLVQYDDEFFIDYGWETFVRDHFLECGDSLVFRYDGGLQFTVQIFDQSSCEKESAFGAECCQDTRNFNKQFDKKREMEIADLLDDIGVSVSKKMRSSQVPCLTITKYQDPNFEITDRQEHLQDETDGFSNCFEYSGNLSTVTVAMPFQSRPGNSAAPANNELLSVADAERIARSFASPFPNFTKVMKRFNISGSYTLNIPYQFSMAHLPNCKLKIVLRNYKGKSWTVNTIPTTKVQTLHTFCGGWLAFVRDNDINVGDICIFELVQSCEFNVQILRVLNAEGFDFQDSKPVTKKSGCVVKKMRGISQKVKHVSSQVKTSNSVNINKSANLRDKHTVGFVSLKSAPEEKMAAESFISNLPHFVRSMKKFNISGSYTLKVPYQFSMKHLPNCRTEIKLRNLKGDIWRVNSVVTTKVETLHTFCGGWMAFVRDNDIKIDDICIFELIGKCEMRVHISGAGKREVDYQSGKGASEDNQPINKFPFCNND